MVNETKVDAFVNALQNVMEIVHSSASFWRDALHLAKRAVNV
jgi:hypothetical protein